MDAINMIKARRSVRKYKEDSVNREIIKEIISVAKYAPSWANTQTARYTIVNSKSIINKLADEAMNGFAFNIKTAKRAAGIVVVSAVKRQSGYNSAGGIVTKKNNSWEMFDAGIACQTFCLAAHEKGIGTVIMGIFDEDKAAEIVNLPANEVVTAIIAYGYPIAHKGIGGAPERKGVDEITRFI